MVTINIEAIKDDLKNYASQSRHDISMVSLARMLNVGLTTMYRIVNNYERLDSRSYKIVLSLQKYRDVHGSIK